jgi:DNA-binding FadR family transcriptional regulator
MAIIQLTAIDQVVQGTVAKIQGLHAGHVPGARFSVQALTAARYGVNEAAVAEAYRVLEAYGWLERSGTNSAPRWTVARGTEVPVGARPRGR